MNSHAQGPKPQGTKALKPSSPSTSVFAGRQPRSFPVEAQVSWESLSFLGPGVANAIQKGFGGMLYLEKLCGHDFCFLRRPQNSDLGFWIYCILLSIHRGSCFDLSLDAGDRGGLCFFYAAVEFREFMAPGVSALG